MGHGESPVGDSLTIRGSVAVRLRDAVTGGRPRGSPTVALEHDLAEFVETPSGTHVVTNLDCDDDSVIVEVTAGEQYLPERRDVPVLDNGGDRTPTTIDLLPAPAYRFPADATVVRGATKVATTEDDEVVGNVALEVIAEPAESNGDDDDEITVARGRSDAEGEFVLPFLHVVEFLERRELPSALTDDETDPPKAMLITIDGEDPVIEASTSDEGLSASHSVAVPESETRVTDIILSENE